jgi:RNA polymerase sigma-70 factor (sigma-E family)
MRTLLRLPSRREPAPAAGNRPDDIVPALFRTYAADLVRLGYCLTGDRGAAEEAVQDAFVSLYRNWDGLRDHASLLPYLRACVVNRSRSVHRRRFRTVLAVEPLTPEVGVVPGPDAGVVAREESLRLFEAVRALPQRQREVVACRYYLDLTEQQTADLLEISVGSVKKHASRALARLHDRLEAIR